MKKEEKQAIAEAKGKIDEIYELLYLIQDIDVNGLNIHEVKEKLRVEAKELHKSLMNVCLQFNSQDVEASMLELDLLITSATGLSSFERSEKTRKRIYVEARQIHMALLNVTYKLTFDAAGKHYNKDHATAMHAKKEIKNLYQTNESA